MSKGERRNKISREESIPRQGFRLHWQMLFAELPRSEFIQSYRPRPVGSELNFRKPAGGLWDLLGSHLQGCC